MRFTMFRQIGAPRTARFTRVALGSRAETRVLTRLPGATRVKRAVLGAPICRNHAFYDVSASRHAQNSTRKSRRNARSDAPPWRNARKTRGSGRTDLPKPCVLLCFLEAGAPKPAFWQLCIGPEFELSLSFFIK